jgi:hypothetical protein
MSTTRQPRTSALRILYRASVSRILIVPRDAASQAPLGLTWDLAQKPHTSPRVCGRGESPCVAPTPPVQSTVPGASGVRFPDAESTFGSEHRAPGIGLFTLPERLTRRFPAPTCGPRAPDERPAAAMLTVQAGNAAVHPSSQYRDRNQTSAAFQAAAERSAPTLARAPGLAPLSSAG